MALQNKGIAFDTSMLLEIGRNKIDVFSELKKMFGKAEFIVPEQVVSELKMLEGRKGKGKMQAGIALMVLDANKAERKKVEAKNADSALLKLAKQGFVVATNDAGLRKSIKNVAGSVIYLRKGAFLVFEGETDV